MSECTRQDENDAVKRSESRLLCVPGEQDELVTKRYILGAKLTMAESQICEKTTEGRFRLERVAESANEVGNAAPCRILQSLYPT